MVVCTTSSHQSSLLHYYKQHFNGGCCYWYSFVIDHLTTAGDHHGDFGDFLFLGFWMVKFEISNKILITKVGRFQIHHGKHHLSCCCTSCMPFPFIPMLLVYSIRSSKSIEKKNYGKRAKFDGEIAATELDPDMAGRYRDPVKDSYRTIYDTTLECSRLFANHRPFSLVLSQSNTLSTSITTPTSHTIYRSVEA
jgi:hypothetical protein